MKPVVIAAAVAGWTLLTAGSCATTQGPVQAQRVEVPVPVKCAADPGPDPTFADTPQALGAAGDLFERTKLLLAGRLQRDSRIAELKAANTGCR